MSELGKSEVPALIRGSCFSLGYVFGPGTTLGRTSDDKTFKLCGVLSNWNMDGEISYLTVADDQEQCWVLESDLMEGSGKFFVIQEVLAEHIAARREDQDG